MYDFLFASRRAGLALGALSGVIGACSSSSLDDVGSRLPADATVDSSGGGRHEDASGPGQTGGLGGGSGGRQGGAGGAMGGAGGAGGAVGGAGGAGGAAGDAGVGPKCSVSLDTFVCGSSAQPHSARCCAEKYSDILAPGCSEFIGEHPHVSICGGVRVFTYGHDGSQSCVYDLSTGALVGAESCGAPPLYSSTCPCTTGGRTVTEACAGPTPLCLPDAATD